MICYFYNNDVKIEEIKNDPKINMSTTSFGKELILEYCGHKITLLPEDGYEFITTLESPKKCSVETYDDIVVLKYLFEKYDLLFYDEEYEKMVSYLNKDKDTILYDNAIRSYILDCLCFYGIIKHETLLGLNFSNSYILGISDRVRYRRMNIDLFKKKIHLFFLKLYQKIRFWK